MRRMGDRQQLLLLAYVSLLGLLLSLIAVIDDSHSWTPFLNILVESPDPF